MKRIHATALPFIAVLILATGCEDRTSATANPATNPATVAGSKLPPLLQSSEIPKLTPTIIDEPGIRMFGDIEVRFEFYPEGSRRSEKDEGWNACNDSGLPIYLTVELLRRDVPLHGVIEVEPERCVAVSDNYPPKALAVLKARRDGKGQSPETQVSGKLVADSIFKTAAKRVLLEASDDGHPCARANALLGLLPKAEKSVAIMEECAKAVSGEPVDVLSKYFGGGDLVRPNENPKGPPKHAHISAGKLFSFQLEGNILREGQWLYIPHYARLVPKPSYRFYATPTHYPSSILNWYSFDSDDYVTIAFRNSKEERVRACHEVYDRYRGD